MRRAPLTPVFVDRKAAAEMLMISVDTFETWLRAGFIPGPTISRGQIVRWHWPTLEEKLLNSGPPPQHDPSVLAVLNSEAGRPRAKRHR